MKNLLFFIVIISCFVSFSYSQLGEFKLSERTGKLSISPESSIKHNLANTLQLKKRKTVNTYFGAGYSFMIFTSKHMQDAFPIFDSRYGTFLTNINLFIGFAVAQAVTLEFEPTILFSSNDKIIDYKLSKPYNGQYNYGHTTTNSILAFPLMANVRFFPFFKLTGFGRLFFVGGGAGAMWIREENDIYYNDEPFGGGYYGGIPTTQATNQWAPMFRMMTGFTGTGGQFGFGGELRYNIVPLKQETSVPFATRFSTNANSVDITLRFYFSL
jgi:hypothetical protein